MTRCIRLLLVVLVAVLPACGGPPPTKIDRLYQGLSDQLPRIDASILRGRRVLIDPGHGGFFRGTVGQDSLEESNVNLGVSLYLWGLLREAGADVYLTRSIDRDFLEPGDSSLATDLQSRVDMSDTLRPDVFLSIHHNAEPGRDPKENSVETYYKAGDPASLALAFDIHRHLMRNLGIDVGEVRQGNYFVLRNNEAPSVLGESSYLTHPAVEKKLRLSEKQRLEAEAYFLGLLDYFSRGIPRIALAAPTDSVLHAVPTLDYDLEDDGGIGIDPDGASLELNGEAVVPVLGPGNHELVYRIPWDAPNGDYEAALTVRNLLGNSSPVFRTRFVIDLPPALAAFDNLMAPRGGVARVRARLLDTRGVPVRDGTAVDVVTPQGRTTALVRDGRVDVAVTMPATGKPVEPALECRGERYTTKLVASGTGQATTHSVFVCDARDGSPIFDANVSAPGMIGGGGSSDGTYALPEGVAGIRISANGYVPYEPEATVDADTVPLSPWFGGALIGKRFVLDPEGGRARDVGMGPLGLSASYVNLRMADYLAGFLRTAGAQVRMTRTDEQVPTPEDVARLTNRWHADRYIEIRHRAEPPESGLAVSTLHFPGSRVGVAMATTVAAAMSRRLGYPARPVAAEVTYVLQQTACPAIVIEAPSMSNVEEELKLDTAWYVREQAYAAFLGILEHFSVSDVGVVQVTVPGQSDWMVTLAGTWTLLTDPDGRAVFEHLAPGPYPVRLQKGDRSMQRSVVLEGASVDLTVEP